MPKTRLQRFLLVSGLLLAVINNVLIYLENRRRRNMRLILVGRTGHGTSNLMDEKEKVFTDHD